MDSEYYINVTIGTPGQLFTIIIDTITSNMVIPDINCDMCDNTRKFDSSKSSTYQKTNYSYVDNPSKGIYGQDFVRFGNTGGDQLVIPNAMFVQSYITVGDDISDGVIGLGFTEQSTDLIDSPIMTAIKAGILDNPIITVFLKGQEGNSSSNSGTITYGALDTANCDSNVVYEPLGLPNVFSANISSTSLGSKKFFGNWPALVESGSSTLMGPSYVVDAFAKEINATYNSQYYFYTVDCNVKFSLNLTIGDTMYTLTEKQMVTHYDNMCVFELIPFGSNIWTLGKQWFEVVCNVLDYGNKRIGFTKVISS